MDTIENFIDSICSMHVDNAQRFYVAKSLHDKRSHDRDVSPLTNFVFEYFLFNSLYAVDWEQSFSEHRLVHHPRETDEAKMQRQFITFCRDRCKSLDREVLTSSFTPLAALADLSGSWTTVTSDDQIGETDGERFFSKIAELGQLVRNHEMTTTKSTFGLIDNCCYFVYLVRNNIFHGSKALGEFWDANQARRIGVYDLFLRCLNSLFFRATGQTQYGSAFVQLPIAMPSIGLNMEYMEVVRMVRDGLLKKEDSAIHWRLFRDSDGRHDLTSKRTALFYPSAGSDMLFPVIVGLPYCTDFYFYNKPLMRGSRHVQQALDRIGIPSPSVHSEGKDVRCFEFEIASVPRRVWIMNRDNKTFLEEDVTLAFFFHRGDSEGEGGSGQHWDSDLLPRLLQKGDPAIGLRLLTDGQPGGISEDVRSGLQHVSLPNSHRKRDYWYGLLPCP